jgi:hypothetical protein
MRLSTGGLLKFSLFAALVYFVGQWAFIKLYDSRWEYRATERVRMMLERMKPGGDRGQAACLWSRGSLNIPDGDAFQVVDALDAWSRKLGFASVSEFEILGARLERDPGPLEEAVVFVDVRIAGKPHTFRVVQGEAISEVSG